jgi:hypothetical protein
VSAAAVLTERVLPIVGAEATHDMMLRMYLMMPADEEEDNDVELPADTEDDDFELPADAEDHEVDENTYWPTMSGNIQVVSQNPEELGEMDFRHRFHAGFHHWAQPSRLREPLQISCGCRCCDFRL